MVESLAKPRQTRQPSDQRELPSFRVQNGENCTPLFATAAHYFSLRERFEGEGAGWKGFRKRLMQVHDLIEDEKSGHADKDHERHLHAGFAIDFWNQV